MYLALSNDRPRTTAEIADRTQIPPGYLSKVLRILSQAGLLEARRGIGGGFMLAKEPATMSVLDVLSAVDGGVTRIDACPLGSFEHQSLCAMHRMLDDVNKYTEDKFKITTIQKLLESADESHPLCDPSQRLISPAINGENRSQDMTDTP
jgi:Rrf2 family iron-sulfur cluster assembly transcriptional regulator